MGQAGLGDHLYHFSDEISSLHAFVKKRTLFNGMVYQFNLQKK